MAPLICHTTGRRSIFSITEVYPNTRKHAWGLRLKQTLNHLQEDIRCVRHARWVGALRVQDSCELHRLVARVSHHGCLQALLHVEPPKPLLCPAFQVPVAMLDQVQGSFDQAVQMQGTPPQWLL